MRKISEMGNVWTLEWLLLIVMVVDKVPRGKNFGCVVATLFANTCNN